MSIPLRNGDWDTMGAIQSAEVRVYPTRQYTNLAPNPSFEKTMVVIPNSNWVSNEWEGTNDGTQGNILEWSTNQSHSGTHSMRLGADPSVPTGNTPILGMNQGGWGPEAGQTWRCSLWYKGTGTAFLRFIWQIGDSAYWEESSFQVTETWTEHQIIKVLPAGVFEVWMDTLPHPDYLADFYVDDAYFGRVPANGDIQVALSRDGGSTFTPAPITCDETPDPWKGTINSYDITAQSALIVEGETENE